MNKEQYFLMGFLNKHHFNLRTLFDSVAFLVWSKHTLANKHENTGIRYSRIWFVISTKRCDTTCVLLLSDQIINLARTNPAFDSIIQHQHRELDIIPA